MPFAIGVKRRGSELNGRKSLQPMKPLSTVLRRLLPESSACLVGAFSSTSYAQSKLPCLDPSLPILKRVDDLVSWITIDEKVS